MEIVGGVFDIPSDIEITLEGIPQTFSHDKLLAMKQCGMNRISMGVQQLDEELIKASGRRQRADQVFRTLESCQALDLPISVDLIFGWPNQTIEQMVRDLETVAATGVAHITHYELNVAGRTDFARNRRGELPSQEENLEMYRAGKAVLEARGYTQMTPYDFERRDSAVPERLPLRRAVPEAVRDQRQGAPSASTPGAGATPASRSSSAPRSRRGGRS